MSDYVPTAFFDVQFGSAITGLSGQFISVSGLGVEFDYDVYVEGGSNYPRYFFKNVVPQVLTLEQGTVTTTDAFAEWLAKVNSGVALTLDGVITLKDHAGQSMRSWAVAGAFPLKYIGPSLNSMASELAVSRIELRHNGCL
jgi:phage tail-like protein